MVVLSPGCWARRTEKLALSALLLCPIARVHAQKTEPAEHPASYIGFDRNDYPGDSALPALHNSFSFTGYWLNNPPGETADSWAGKRDTLRQFGFGFLLLFNGRSDAQLKAVRASGQTPTSLGAADGVAAAAAARHEGFPPGVVIFLDQEEGGRLLPEQADYVFAWVDAVRAAGERPGVYCSGVEVREGKAMISTAQDIAEREHVRAEIGPSPKKPKPDPPLLLWIANDQCPPSPGCTLAPPALATASFGALHTAPKVWQYAQSPRRAHFSASCPTNQAADGNCYAPGMPSSPSTFVDLDQADSADPSEGR